jgi:hypothetical protein
MQRQAAAAVVFVALAGCAKNVTTDPHNTGGGGVSIYEGHSARKQDASGTGSSASNFGSGAVPNSGAKDEPGNAESASQSNGGQGTHGNPNALL